MKHLRNYLPGILCFALAWLAASSMSKLPSHDSSTTESINSRTSSSRISRTLPNSRELRINKITSDFSSLPTERWAERWSAFNQDANVEELQILSSRVGPILPRLAVEELAMRSPHVIHKVEGALAALAETDPDLAWADFLTKDPGAIIRTLASRNPQATLLRLQNVPRLQPVNRLSELDHGALWHTPYSSLFGAWARTDPSSAAAAMKSLPVMEQAQAANGLALTWSTHNGPAALNFILNFAQGGRSSKKYRALRIDIVLRTALTLQPRETAQFLATQPRLREMMSDVARSSLIPWYRADPAAAISWLGQKGDKVQLYDLAEYVCRSTPDDIEGFFSQVSAAGVPDLGNLKISLARFYPTATEVNANTSISYRIEHHPDAVLADYLAAYRSSPTPEAAIESLQWIPKDLYQLAFSVANLIPEKAPELAAALPSRTIAEGFHQDHRQFGGFRFRAAITRFWPDLQPNENPASTYRESHSTFPKFQFLLDPIAAAEQLLTEQKIPESDASRAIDELYKKDPAAARAWISRLEPGPARDAAELSLAKNDAVHDPAATLRYLAANRELPNNEVLPIYFAALKRLLYTGGNWQGALAKIPGNLRTEAIEYRLPTLPEAMEHEAWLLKTLLALSSR